MQEFLVTAVSIFLGAVAFVALTSWLDFRRFRRIFGISPIEDRHLVIAKVRQEFNQLKEVSRHFTRGGPHHKTLLQMQELATRLEIVL